MSTAFLRAAHVVIDDAPPVLDDRMSLLFLPFYQRQYLAGFGQFSNPWTNRLRRRSDPFNTMRAHIVVRARYAEDALETARRQGAERYVVLAAGLDTFAWRQPAARVRVLEIDHPATQGWKRRLLGRSGLATPDDVEFLPINFEHLSLRDVWHPGPGVDFISWLGVTYYLSREATAGTLAALAALTPARSQLVFDFWTKPTPLEQGLPLLLGTRIAVALLREPMQSFYTLEEIRALAASTGWTIREVMTPADQNERYLSGRTDRLGVPSFSYLVRLENSGALAA